MLFVLATLLLCRLSASLPNALVITRCKEYHITAVDLATSQAVGFSLYS